MVGGKIVDYSRYPQSIYVCAKAGLGLIGRRPWRTATFKFYIQNRIREKQLCVGSVLTSRIVCDLTYMCRSADINDSAIPVPQFPAPTLVLANQLWWPAYVF